LANPNYFDVFGYVPNFQPLGRLRADYIIDDDEDETNDDWVSDKVRVCLNLAYINDKIAHDFVLSEQKLDTVS
jgi:hypothetical protein